MELPRHAMGREAFSVLLDSWIRASTLTPTQWCRLAELCLGVRKLNPAQVSGVRTGVVRQLGVPFFDALASVNAEAWKYHADKQTKLQGDDVGMIACVPPLSIDDSPADLADLVLVYVGLEKPPALPERWLEIKVEQSSPVDMSRAAGKAIRQAVARKGFADPLDGFAAFIAHYPTGDKARLGRLREVCFGISEFSPSEVEQELAAICIALRGFTGSDWSPRQIAEVGLRQKLP